MTIKLRRLPIPVILASALAVTILLLNTGCDTDTSSSDIEISPTTVVVTNGQSVIFTASGGYDYTWSLVPDDGSGFLDNWEGPSVIYTCLATNVGSTPKKVVVKSTIAGSASGSSSSNSMAAYSVQASANIFYPNGTGGGGGPLIISPHTATISTNTPRTQVFTVSGGNGDFSWSLANNNGSISSFSGPTTTYTANASTNVSNTISCRDSASHSDQATINQ
jgi:hypothetical protein